MQIYQRLLQTFKESVNIAKKKIKKKTKEYKYKKEQF